MAVVHTEPEDSGNTLRNVLGIVVGLVVVVLLIMAMTDSGPFSNSDNTADAAAANATATAMSQQSSTATAAITAKPTGTPPTSATVNGTASGTTSGATSSAAVCPGDQAIPDPRPNQGVPTIVDAGCIVKGDVEVGSSQSGPFAPAHTHDGMGNLLECPEGCWIVASYGANVSDRTLQSLLDEQSATGCADNAGCAVVHVWCFNEGNLTEVTNGGTCLGTNTKSPTGANANCRGEMTPGETRTLSAGCIIVGDVVVNDVLQKPVGRNRNDVGYVEQLTSDTTVTAPWGAGVYDQSWNVDDLVKTTKQFGCDQDPGCSGGVYNWEGQRLDQ